MKMNDLLLQKGLVLEYPSIDSIKRRMRETGDDKLKILYGETYDEFGNTIDSVKYYIFVANLVDVLKNEGIKSDARILVADTGVTRNIPEEKELALKLGKNRGQFVDKVKDVYGCGYRTQFMSEFIETLEFQQRLKHLQMVCKADSILMGMVEKSAPPDKLEITRKQGFLYSFEELATIHGLDLKVGPPRETLYDEISREISRREGTKELLPIYLTPSYPLDVNFDYFIKHPEIERDGLTPYKAKSKGMTDHRILIGKSTENDVKKLIENSFLSKDSTLPNPVLDMAIIGEMAKQRLEGRLQPITLHNDFYSEKINPTELKQIAISNVTNYIIKKL